MTYPSGLCKAFLVLHYAWTVMPLTPWQEKLLALSMVRADGMVAYPRRGGKRTLAGIVERWEGREIGPVIIDEVKW